VMFSQVSPLSSCSTAPPDNCRCGLAQHETALLVEHLDVEEARVRVLQQGFPGLSAVRGAVQHAVGRFRSGRVRVRLMPLEAINRSFQ
jgi:hypothetical protein